MALARHVLGPLHDPADELIARDGAPVSFFGFEVPRLRLVARQDFTFLPGIDVTDVRQIKGLEFDYVVVLDPTRQSYPERDESRHLLHIASTRTAYQLWLICSGEVSPLIPADLSDVGGDIT